MGFDERIKIGGWTSGEKVTAAQLNQMDIDRGNAVDKTGDTIVGASIAISEEAILAIEDGGQLTVNSGSQVVIQDGASLDVTMGADVNIESDGTVTFEPGSNLYIETEFAEISGLVNVSNTVNIANGGKINVASGGDIIIASGGALEINGSTNWPALSSRSHVVWEAPRLLGSTVSDMMEHYYSGDYPCLKTDYRTTSEGKFWLGIPKGPEGATLISVSVMTKGMSGTGSGTLVLPTYQVKRFPIVGSNAFDTPEDLSGIATDLHTTSNWTTDWFTTPIVVNDAMSYIDGMYAIYVTTAYNASDDTYMMVGGVCALYTVTQLRY